MVRGEAPAENGFYAHLRSERSHLEHLFQYQLVRSRHFRNSNSSTFKDLQTEIQGLSRTMSVFKDFPGLENLEKKIQGLSRTRKSLVSGFPHGLDLTCSICGKADFIKNQNHSLVAAAAMVTHTQLQ